MTPEFAAVCPPSLAPLASGLSLGEKPAASLAGRLLHERATLARILAVFGRRFPGADGRALLSYWTQFYFTTLIVPTVAALVCLGREWPVGLDAVDLSLDEEGRVERFWVGAVADEGEAGLATLVSHHLAPFIDACAAYNGLSRRTLWCNAGAVLDYALAHLPASELMRQNGPGEIGQPNAGVRGAATSLLFAPFRGEGDLGERTRRVCCLRSRLPGVAACPGICPLRKDRRADL